MSDGGRREPRAVGAAVADLSEVDPDTITVDLTLHDVAILAVALADVAAPDGHPAWSHPRVERLRMKLANAITRRVA
jgi:hypothetical protein